MDLKFAWRQSESIKKTKTLKSTSLINFIKSTTSNGHAEYHILLNVSGRKMAGIISAPKVV